MKRLVVATAMLALGWLAPGSALRAQTPPSPQSPPLAAASAGPVATPDTAEPIEQITIFSREHQNKAIRDFVQSYAAPPQTLHGQLARWKIGICPQTTGLNPEQSEAISQRVRDIAVRVGAPVDENPQCKTNLQIIFTKQPQVVMTTIRTKAPWLLGSHYKAQEKELATLTHPVQAWYATATEDFNGALSLDDIGDVSNKCRVQVPAELCGLTSAVKMGSHPSAGPCEIQTNVCDAVKGSRISLGLRSEFTFVTVVIDGIKADAPLRALADYIAVLALAQTKTFDGCKELASITNLLSPECDAGSKAKAVTANDLAYLRGLYEMNPVLNAGFQRINLAIWMQRSLEHPK